MSHVADIPELKNAVIKHALCPHLTSYREIDEMDYFDVRLKMECISAENGAMKAQAKEQNFLAREGIKKVT